MEGIVPQASELGQISKENTLCEEVDTNTQESRLKRALNQYDFEKEGIKSTFSMPLMERFFTVRLAIFRGFSNVLGEDIQKQEMEGKILSDNRKKIEVEDQFVPYTSAAEQALEKFIPNIDYWYKKIVENNDTAERRQIVERFLAVLYVGGVSIQPSVDGNKQTFKILVESYMKDLLPETENLYPPTQETDSEWHSNEDMGTVFLGGNMAPESCDITSVSVPGFEPTDLEEKTIVDALELIQKLDKRMRDLKSDEDLDKAINSKREIVLRIAHSLGRETNNPEFSNIGKQMTHPDSAYWDLKRVSIKRLREKALHDTWQMYVTVFGGSGQKIDRASWTVKKLWGTDEGKRFIEEYIFDNKKREGFGEDSESILFWKTSNALERQRTHMWKVMEDEKQHKERHDRLLKKYRNSQS